MHPPLETTKTTVTAHLDEINERLNTEGNRTVELYNAECVALWVGKG
jgi:DNA-binding ferritin-like protein